MNEITDEFNNKSGFEEENKPLTQKFNEQAQPPTPPMEHEKRELTYEMNGPIGDTVRYDRQRLKAQAEHPFDDFKV